jgi:hypothetical protein
MCNGHAGDHGAAAMLQVRLGITPLLDSLHAFFLDLRAESKVYTCPYAVKRAIVYALA